MSWLLSPNGCRGRIRESLLHPLRRKFPPRAASLAKEQQPELANAANRNWNKKFQRSCTGNSLTREQSCSGWMVCTLSRTAQSCHCHGLVAWRSRAVPPHCPQPHGSALLCLPSEQPVAWITKPGNHLSHVALNMTKSHLACSSVQLRALAFFIHFSFPCQGKDCFFHLLEEKSLGC